LISRSKKSGPGQCGSGSSRAAANPCVTRLDIGALHRRPCDAVRGLFLARVALVVSEGVVERLAEDVLSMFGEVRTTEVGSSSLWEYGTDGPSGGSADFWAA
jgi:hypothetical protein